MEAIHWVRGGIVLYLTAIGVLSLFTGSEPNAMAPFFALLAAAVLLVGVVELRRPAWKDVPVLLATLAAGVSAWYWIAAESNTTVANVIVVLALPSMATSGFLGYLAYVMFGKSRNN